MSPPAHPTSGQKSPELPPNPVISGFELGPFETNTYVVAVPGSSACWIVDPSFGPAPVIEAVRRGGLTPVAVVLTHAHVDHIAGVSEVVAAFSTAGGPGGPGGAGKRLPVWVHAAEAAWLADPMLNLSAMTGMNVTAPGPDRLLNDGDVLELAGTKWRVLHTPGHSPGGVTFHHEESGQAIVGDTLFAGSVGRTDFPGSDPATLVRSIKTRLYVLPESTKIYPGHGPDSTIGREMRSNPFVQG